jgi:peptidoglycan/LPS O-acetylase OafA/YrhL
LPVAGEIEAEPSVRERFYRPELDALRFFAFFCVFLAHGLPSHEPYSLLALSGGFGLCLFFLLSAYLITELLLRERSRTGTVHLRAFYARRILRIWPLYFAMLAFGYFFGIVRPDAAWGTGRLLAYLFLLGNFYTARHGQIMNPAGALWSISVEEQFYLLWPSVAKKGIRSLLLVSSLVIPVSYFWMYVLYRAGTSLEQGIWTNSLVQFQFFGIGGLLALAFRSGSPNLNSALRILMLLAGVSLWLVAGGPLQLFGTRDAVSLWQLMMAYGSVALGCALLLTGILGAPSTWFPKPLVYLGKISYGLYAYHLLGLRLSESLVFRWHSAQPGSGTPVAARLPMALAITIIFAALSYRFFESPFLRLKERFTFIPSRKV